ncbi:hypothetical protein Aperf_G00000015698 [Anoplocephala perfoliata]
MSFELFNDWMNRFVVFTATLRRWFGDQTLASRMEVACVSVHRDMVCVRSLYAIDQIPLKVPLNQEMGKNSSGKFSFLVLTGEEELREAERESMVCGSQSNLRCRLANQDAICGSYLLLPNVPSIILFCTIRFDSPSGDDPHIISASFSFCCSSSFDVHCYIRHLSIIPRLNHTYHVSNKFSKSKSVEKALIRVLLDRYHRFSVIGRRISDNKVSKAPYKLQTNKFFTATAGLIIARVMVHADGSILWIPQALFKSAYQVDITYFPFDTEVQDLNELNSLSYLENLLVVANGLANDTESMVAIKQHSNERLLYRLRLAN